MKNKVCAAESDFWWILRYEALSLWATHRDVMQSESLTILPGLIDSWCDARAFSDVNFLSYVRQMN